jgi:hypothetical protein
MVVHELKDSKIESNLKYLKGVYDDSVFEEKNDYIYIKFGMLKRISNLLIDSGANFIFKNNQIILEKKELRMI